MGKQKQLKALARIARQLPQDTEHKTVRRVVSGEQMIKAGKTETSDGKRYHQCRTTSWLRLARCRWITAKK